MDLKKKLSRLGPRGRPTTERTRGEMVGGRAPGGESSAESRSHELDSLRGKMAEILGRESPRPRPPADPAETLLPFARIETEWGTVHRRSVRLAPSHHVGRMPVDAARTANAGMLGLLALSPEVAGEDLGGALFVDTETTGLGGGAGTIAFLLGLLWFDGEVTVMEQLLLRHPADEPAMLELFRERVAEASMLVSYNGKSFDLPLLETRFVMNRSEPPARLPHLDLLHLARRLHGERIGACSLKRVESHVLGFERDEDIDGADVAPRYAHFLRTGDEGALAAVVEHNAWDVVSMAALVGLYGEPLETLHDQDLLGLARTLKRARALEQAEEVASTALRRGVGPAALELRGRIAKARGDRAKALGDFEELAEEVDDDAVRLELAKLYEHYVKEPLRALELVKQGTGEPEEATAKRRSRLERKIERGRRR